MHSCGNHATKELSTSKPTNLLKRDEWRKRDVVQVHGVPVALSDLWRGVLLDEERLLVDAVGGHEGDPSDDALQAAELALVGATAAATEDDGASVGSVGAAQEDDGLVHRMRGQPVLPEE